MPSAHFSNLASSVQELKRIYLDGALTAPVPSADHQELARAFVTLAHSELEYYAEEACRQLASEAFNAGVAGSYSRATIALIGFSGLEPLRAGSTLSVGKKKAPRLLSMRLGAAHAALIRTIDGNNGVRERHLAAIAIPLGLDADRIDNTWLNELDAFCSFRGAFAHMSRTSQRGSHLAVNPQDVWQKCERLIWTNPALAAQGVVNSFESLDLWIEAEKQSFGPYVKVAAWRLRLVQFLIGAVAGLRRKKQSDNDED